MGIYLYLIKTDWWTYKKYLENPQEIKIYKFKFNEEAINLGNFFLEKGIDDYCNCFVEPYGTDFLNKDQCILLKKWITENKNIIQENNFNEIFNVLEDYCKQAIELDTGIEIDL